MTKILNGHKAQAISIGITTRREKKGGQKATKHQNEKENNPNLKQKE